VLLERLLDIDMLLYDTGGKRPDANQLVVVEVRLIDSDRSADPPE
jgi:hypothetical protein